LAAALAVPILPSVVEGANPRDLLIFLVFCVIVATFVLQGLTLPWILKILGITKYGQREQYSEHLAELDARLRMTKAVLHWLREYNKEIKDNQKLAEQVRVFTDEYAMLKNRLQEIIAQHDGTLIHDEKAEMRDESILLMRIIEIEKKELLTLWHEGKINLAVRNKLLSRLDHRFEHIPT
jgi:CPA1 family monovalent cation:H+ antiporter